MTSLPRLIYEKLRVELEVSTISYGILCLWLKIARALLTLSKLKFGEYSRAVVGHRAV